MLQKWQWPGASQRVWGSVRSSPDVPVSLHHRCLLSSAFSRPWLLLPREGSPPHPPTHVLEEQWSTWEEGALAAQDGLAEPQGRPHAAPSRGPGEAQEASSSSSVSWVCGAVRHVQTAPSRTTPSEHTLGFSPLTAAMGPTEAPWRRGLVMPAEFTVPATGPAREQVLSESRAAPACGWFPQLSMWKPSNQAWGWAEQTSKERASPRELVISPSPRLKGSTGKFGPWPRTTQLSSLPTKQPDLLSGDFPAMFRWKLNQVGTSAKATSKVRCWGVSKTPDGDSRQGAHRAWDGRRWNGKST